MKPVEEKAYVRKLQRIESPRRTVPIEAFDFQPKETQSNELKISGEEPNTSILSNEIHEQQKQISNFNTDNKTNKNFINIIKREKKKQNLSRQCESMEIDQHENEGTGPEDNFIFVRLFILLSSYHILFIQYFKLFLYNDNIFIVSF